MEDTPQSLANLALIKMVSMLWNHKDICVLIHKTTKVKKNINWHMVESAVIKNILQVPVPKIVKQRLACIVKPIGMQLLDWITYIANSCEIENVMPNIFSWTPQGTVDYKKAAQVLVRNQDIDLKKRYILACLHCLEEEIPFLWHQLPNWQRKQLHGREATLDNSNPSFLVSHLTHKLGLDRYSLKRKEVVFEYSDYFCVVEAVKSGDIEAAKYFFQKLSQTERKSCFMEICVVKYFKRMSTLSNILYFFLSKLEDDQRVEVMKANRSLTLHTFLHWPYQSLFMKMTSYLWDSLHKINALIILHYMTFKVKIGYKDWNYQHLFGEFWKKMPQEHKRFGLYKNTEVFSHNGNGLFRQLLEIRDYKNFRIVLKEATVEEGIKIFSSRHARALIIKALKRSSSEELVQCVIELKERIMSDSSTEDMETKKKNLAKVFLKFNNILGDMKKAEEYENNAKRRRSCRIREQRKRQKV